MSQTEHLSTTKTIKMMIALFFVMLLTALRHCAGSDSNPENIDHLMDHVLVVRVPHREVPPLYIRLTCLETSTDDNVFWKRDGEASPSLQGNVVKVMVEEMNGGNYSCHSPAGLYLNHTLVLVQLDSDNSSVILQKSHHPHHGHGEYIQCSGHNYSGSFRCSWKRTAERSEATVLMVKAEQYSRVISCEQDSDGSGMRCNLPNCPYQEEKHRISVILYMRNAFRLEAYHANFYLRDIVRPEPVERLRTEAGGVFHWDPPATWEKPCTYFSLNFQVKLVHHGQDCHSNPMNNNQPEIIGNQTYSVSVKAKKYVFCVRAKEKVTDGPWSHWRRCSIDLKKTRHHECISSQ